MSMELQDALSPIGLGTSRLASLGSAISVRQAEALFRTAFDHGIRVIDTADAYGSGDSERMIGRGIRGHRDKFFVITKAGLPCVSLPSLFSPLNQITKKVVQKMYPSRDFSKKHLLKSLARSLKRLGTDHVDGFLLHEASAGEVPPEAWEALWEIRQKGMSRAVGVSTSDVDVVRQAIACGAIQMVESPIAVTASNAIEIGNLCASSGLLLVGNEVLHSRKFIQGSGDQWIEMRTRHGCANISTIQLLVGFAASRPGVSTVLIGTRSPDHLIECLDGLRYITSLAPLFKEMKAKYG